MLYMLYVPCKEDNMDAVVTGRMPAGKKEAGALVLRDLGMTSSQAINWL
jgi:antitoxin component of RelBE/YafQ-DinJ toxin-antitoxin module